MSSHDFPTLKALSMDEILGMIFWRLTKQDNVVNARVCKAWTNEALDVVWRYISATTVFGLLAPLEESDDGTMSFARRLTYSDWARFDRYSGRVRSLSVNVVDDDLCPSMWREIAYGRPRMEILPRLQEVCGSHGSLMTSLFFCHPSVTHFQIFLARNDIVFENFNRALSCLPNKTPRLANFQIHWADGTEELSAETLVLIESALDQLTYLTVLTVSAWCLTPRALDALSSLRLKEIEIISFPRPPPSLVSADISQRCRGIIDSISQPHVESLSLHADSPQPITTFDMICPILSLSRLSFLSLYGVYPSDIDTPHFVTMFQSLPVLTFFRMHSVLAGGPLVHPPPLCLSSLAAIIPFCNNLEHLLIDVDASSNSEALPEPHHRLCFPKLNRLHLQKSPISKPTSVARFLSNILPQDCSLEFVRSWNDNTARNWEMVKEMLPEFFRARSSERERLNRSR